MKRTVREFLRDVARGESGPAVARRAQELLADSEQAAPEKARIQSLVWHDQFLAEVERERDETSRKTWDACLLRTHVDHRRYACELCEKPAALGELEPHHLEYGSGNREQKEAVHNVMAVHRKCHEEFHHRPRSFVAKVIAWCLAHSYPLPARKEYRLAGEAR